MNTQIEELLKTLNKGINHLPGAVNVMVKQYAMQQYVMAGVCFAFALILTIVLIVAGVHVTRYFRKMEEDDRVANGFLLFFPALAVIIAMLVCYTASFRYLSHALAPVISLIQMLR